MDFTELFMMQKKLDRYIEKKNGLESESLLERKLMAFQVELAELANETRSFKFWSGKGPSEDEVILEEYVDGIHFLLSVGIEYGFDNEFRVPYPVLDKATENCLVKSFFTVMEDLITLRKEETKEAYEKLFSNYLKIGAELGFGPEDIVRSYEHKNEVNRHRQDEGY
jgi:dimeric dUTPase (all-alpha-NTP-PPase superfamily)